MTALTYSVPAFINIYFFAALCKTRKKIQTVFHAIILVFYYNVCNGFVDSFFCVFVVSDESFFTRECEKWMCFGCGQGKANEETFLRLYVI